MYFYGNKLLQEIINNYSAISHLFCSMLKVVIFDTKTPRYVFNTFFSYRTVICNPGPKEPCIAKTQEATVFSILSSA